MQAGTPTLRLQTLHTPHPQPRPRERPRRVEVHRGSTLGKVLKVIRPSGESLSQGSLRARTSAITVDLDAQGAAQAQRADLLLHTSHSKPGQGAAPV